MENKTETKELTVEKIRMALDKIRVALEKDNSRLKSWEYCYKIFGEKRNEKDIETIDLLSLHLAFYLASWGMYRGSSFLLQKDYKVHCEAVKELQNEKYNSLRGASLETLSEEKNLNLLFVLKDELNKIYSKKKPEDAKEGVSNMLLTKIIMGVFGCCPAYDTYVTASLKKYGISSTSFDKENFKKLISTFKNYESTINEECENISSEVKYPQMKVIDSILWQLGYSDVEPILEILQPTIVELLLEH